MTMSAAPPAIMPAAKFEGNVDSARNQQWKVGMNCSNCWLTGGKNSDRRRDFVVG